ncbi:MAG: carbamate kinase [Candidatus Marinimicrobia bacterium]|nr:carbamate kinase [Candidatus Neomarinimicrobiota bacterium]
MNKARTAVVALGGNAISPGGQADIHEEFANTRKSMVAIMHFIRHGYHLAITHGNGPQVGNALLRVEVAKGLVPDVPLGVLVAATQGTIGYMIEQSLKNILRREKSDRYVVCMITQIGIDINDPAIKDPCKFIGQFFSKEDIDKKVKTNAWSIKEVPGKGWRRVVPSPAPVKIINRRHIKQLVDNGVIVVAAGGGGIPMYKGKNNNYEGFDAVIDKDLASAVLATGIAAEELFILTGVDKIYRNFGQKDEEALDHLTVEQAESLLKSGEFPAGSMGPKIEGALDFLKNGGKKVVITSLDKVEEALQGKNGTIIEK